MKNNLLFVQFLLILTISAQGQNTCNQPVITQVTGAGTYCSDAEVTLELTGNLNDATTWTWYSGNCGGQSIGTGTSLNVTVDKTTTYFVRGTGGCVASTSVCTEVIVTLDNIGPVILTCPDDTVVVNNQGQCGAVVSFDIPTAEDACSGSISIIQVEGLPSGSFFPVGVTTIQFDIADALGNTSTCAFTVTVTDEELPQVTCPENIEMNNDPGECGAIVTYEVPLGTDNCPNVSTELTGGLGSGAFFPVGVTTETYSVTDASGNTSSCSFTVTVYDIEPPVITVLGKNTRLWPPNHKHHGINIGDYIESVSDNCGGVTIEGVVIDEVGSDEPNNGKGDGNTIDDIVISEDCRSIQLLAERSGTGNGRVYVVALALRDLHGNVGKAEFIVEVPHDMGKNHTVIRDSIVYSVNGCDLESVENSISSSGRESGKIESQLGVYPNPFTSTFTLNFTPAANDHVKVELYNFMGKKIANLYEADVESNTSYSWTIEPPSDNNELSLLLIRGKKNYGTVRLIQMK